MLRFKQREAIADAMESLFDEPFRSTSSVVRSAQAA